MEATASRAAPASEPAPLEQLHTHLAEEMAAVNRVILDRLDSAVPLIPQVARYLIAAGGKRLRPMLTVASARLCGHEGTRHHALAACVEFIHSATLLHDDVVDDSGERRGQKAANLVFGNEASVLVGDFLFARTFQMMVADGSLEVLKILSDASAVIAEGEVLQLAHQRDLELTPDGYRQVIEAKTATLFAAACEIGAVVADRPDADRQALRTYGMELGLAFQIADDVLDYAAAKERLGKTGGDDFREGKLTLPVVLAYQRADGPARQFWERTIGEGTLQDGDLEEALAHMLRAGVLDDCLVMARDHAARAAEALEPRFAGELADMLIAAARYAAERAA